MSKPAKYDLLFESKNAVTYVFMHFIISYCGKPNEGATAYHVKGVEETARYLQDLQNYGNLQERNISFDRLYTSISLVQWLLSLTT